MESEDFCETLQFEKRVREVLCTIAMMRNVAEITSALDRENPFETSGRIEFQMLRRLYCDIYKPDKGKKRISSAQIDEVVRHALNHYNGKVDKRASRTMNNTMKSTGMKIEMVREDWSKEVNDHADAFVYYSLSPELKWDLYTEYMLGIKPDYSLMARIVDEMWYENVDMTDAEHEVLMDALEDKMPEAYDRLMHDVMKNDEDFTFWEYKGEIDWNAIEKLLPESLEDRFSVDALIGPETSRGLTVVLKTIELHVQSGIMMLSMIIRSQKEGEEVEASADLFRKIMITNLILTAPNELKWAVALSLCSGDLADRCLALLSERYGRDLTIKDKSMNPVSLDSAMMRRTGG